MKRKRGPGRPPHAEPRTPLQIRVSADESARFRSAAQARGLVLSAWIRMVCAEAAKPDPRD